MAGSWGLGELGEAVARQGVGRGRFRKAGCTPGEGDKGGS